MNTKNNFVKFHRKTGIIKFKKFYDLKIQYKYLLIIILGIIFGLAIAFLQKNTGIYSVGISGVTQGFARLSGTLLSLNNASAETIDLVFNLIFWGLYLVLNIPLIIFAYLKIGKHFAILSITYLSVVNIVGFSIGFIPNINNVFIFGNTNPENLELVKNNVVILDWGSQDDLIKTISLTFYIIVYAPITGFVLSLLYILGGSTGGADPISIYFSIVKQKSLGNIIIIVNISGLFIANLIGSYIPGGLVDNNFGFTRFFSPNMILSIIYVLTSGFLINKWFPKNKPISVSIYTKEFTKVEQTLRKINYQYSIFQQINSFERDTHKIEIICTYGQFLKLYNNLRNVDQSGLIYTDIIHDLDGNIRIENNTKLRTLKGN